jgi:hypothetical protein
MSNENDMMAVNGMNTMDPALQVHPFGVIPDGSIPGAGSNMTDDQAAQEQLQRSNSMKRYSADSGRNGRLMAGPRSRNPRASFDQNYAGQMANTMASGMNSSIAFSIPNGQNNHSHNQNNNNFASNGTTVQSAVALQTLPNGTTPIQAFSNTSASQQPLKWSQMYHPNSQDRFTSKDNGYTSENIGGSESELEEITAIFMLCVLSTWHGDPFQREKARRQFPLIVSLARKAGLTLPVTTAHQAAENRVLRWK